MISLLQQTINNQQTCQEFNENNKKTEMEWNCLLNYLQPPSKTRIIKNDSPMTLHTDKKFEKDSSGQWVWYKNQVLPTLKIKLIHSNYKQILIDQQDATNLDYFASIQCFAVFSNNQILEVKLEGTSIVKFNKDKIADMRSIRLTETINSLNCRYFLFTLTIFQSREGEESNSYKHLEEAIQRSSHGDEIRMRALKNTLISQCISIQTRKKSLHQRVSLLCQLHPFVPNEFNRLLQMLHGENPEEILSSDIRGLYFYFSNKKIRHKIFHPFYLAARFNKAINLYYLNDGSNQDADLSDVFLSVQKSVEQTLLTDQNDEDCYTNYKKKNQKSQHAQLIVQIQGKKSDVVDNASCQKSSKTQNYEMFKNKVLNYLMPLQSNAIKIIDENDAIPPYYKSINYDETQYGLAYTKIFPKILNTLFEYQEQRAQYPSYLYSAGYSAQKEEATDFSKEANKEKNKQIIKYKSTLVHKYDDTLRKKLAQVPLSNENQQASILKNRSSMQVKEQPQQPSAFTNNNMLIQQQEIPSQPSLTSAMMMKFCNNIQETNRKSYTSNASDTVGIVQPNTNLLDSKQKKQPLFNAQQDNDDVKSQVSDDTQANEGNLDYFTPGDNKIKLTKINTNRDSFLNLQQNSTKLTCFQDNKHISEFKPIDSLLLAQYNSQQNPINHLQDINFSNQFAQTQIEAQNIADQANYSFLMQQLSNQSGVSNNVSSLINFSNSNQNQNLIQNLQQITMQNMKQPQLLQQQQQQQLLQIQPSMGSQLNQAQNVLMLNKLNQVQNQNTSSLNQLLFDNNNLQQNQLIAQNSTLNMVQNTHNNNNNNITNLQNLQQLSINQNNFSSLPQQNILQNQQNQNLLSLIQLQQKQQQQFQLQNLLQQQQQQSQNIQQINEQLNQQHQLMMNPLINQNNQNVFSEVSRKSIPLQMQVPIQQQQLQQQQQQQSNQFSLRTNNNQFDNQIFADICHQMMMPQFQQRS